MRGRKKAPSSSSILLMLAISLIAFSVLSQVSVVHADSVVATINVCCATSNPPAFDSVNGNFYISNGGSVYVVSGLTNSIVASVTIGGSGTPVFDPFNGDIYVPEGNTVSVISGSTNTVIASIEGVVGDGVPAFDSANGEIYVPGITNLMGRSTVSVISGATNKVVANITVAGGNEFGSSFANEAIFDPLNGYIYAGNSIISGATNEVVATIAGSPALLALDSSNGDLYAINECDCMTGAGPVNATVSVISGTTNNMIATISLGSSGFLGGLVFDSANGDVYVSNLSDGLITVISGATNTAIATIDIAGSDSGGQPAFDPSSGNIYAPSYYSVFVISGTTNKVLTIVNITSVVPRLNWAAFDPSNADVYVGGEGSFVYAISEATATTVSCSPPSVDIGEPITCTAEVVEAGQATSSPTGTISWSSSGSGTFSPASCILNGGQCSVTYSPSSHTTPITITANYGGDPTDLPSSGSASLVVRVSTTTTVGCSPISVAVGSAVSCTATVTGASPTGMISWSSNSQGTFSSPSCTNSTGQCSTTYTPSSSTSPVTITAAYGGDFYNSVSSNNFALTVTPAPSSTSVGCSPSSVVVGSSTTCTATVAGFSATGSVTWSSSSGTFMSDSCTLSTGRCSVTYTPSSSGTITASYNGDSNNLISAGTTSVPVVVDIPVKIAVSNSGPSATVALSGCSASPSSIIADGTVQTVQATPGCNIDASLPSSTGDTRYEGAGGVTAFTINTCSSGTCSLYSTVIFYQTRNTYEATPTNPSSWDGAYSIPVSGAFLGSPIGCTITVTGGGAPSSCTAWFDYPAQVTVAATISVSTSEQWAASNSNTFSPVAGGSTYDVNYVKQWSVAINSSPTGDAKTSPSSGWVTDGAATTITAYPNNGYAFGSWSCTGANCYSGTSNPTLPIIVTGPITETVNLKLSTTTTVSCSPSPLTAGASDSCTATVTGQSLNGIITWSSLASGKFSATSCDLSALSGGGCLVRFAPAGAGSATIVATYSGDATYGGSAGTATISVSRVQSSTGVICSPHFGAPASCTATVTGYNPTGTITWSSNMSRTLSATSCRLSNATCSVPYILTPSAPSVKITATYSGDQNNMGSYSDPFSLTGSTVAATMPVTQTATTSVAIVVVIVVAVIVGAVAAVFLATRRR
jgi:DNA-binding beta-propeller fold protein YncE